ncbi:MAG: isoleucine--tRNA ligase [Planctomycetes bacterium]|nr:isoleucine--tRNA ligase [Planctomycetota bacterium]
MNYKDTLNLPKTDFPMAAGLTKMEPRMRERWDSMRLYEKIQDARKAAPAWILHDGPPYANGDVHVGTGQNKVLKDIVVKFRTMQGHRSPFVPGWDCHGLPIEHKVMKELGPRAKTMPKSEIRGLCLDFARKYIDIQRRQFKSLGVFGDWDRPYLTIDAVYETAVIETFELLWKNGHVARRKKSIHWCMNDRTALAEAELEYKSLPSPSIYLRFEGIGGPDLLVWTTTPWTLPADVAVAVHPDLEYAVVKMKGREAVVAPQRIEECRKRFEIGETVRTVKGRSMEGWKYKHPLFGHPCPVVLADYVTITDGTGLVHTAPGHGAEDYETGLQYKLPILSPVDEAGVFTGEAGRYKGLQVFESNPIIVEDLRRSGVLLKDESLEHEYPCCWRCKNPVIFRATEQWFILVDHADGRKRALEAVAATKWVPKWGETRISSMLQERPDWCVSRQRTWGVPIPAFYCSKCRQVLLDQTTFDAVKKLFAKGGADAWFTTDAKDILPAGTRCPCGNGTFTKEEDIFDVWFESAASHRAVSMKHPDLRFPPELYLEGTDQHRGWFQVSLLASLLSNGKAPFKEVVTHGFLVDARTGDKLSKSGFLIPVGEVVEKIGAELLRLWIMSIDFTSDLPMSWEILKQREDPYRKIRNTFRYLLGNLCDFDPAKSRVPHPQMREIDRWILHELSRLVADCEEHYAEYRFHLVYQRVYEFCVVTLSALYFDIVKDRLYTEGRDSVARRSAQTALHELLQALVRILAPVLVHTCEEVWDLMPGAKEAESIHLASWPRPPAEWRDDALAARFEKLLAARNEVNRSLEKLRADGAIGKSLQSRVTVHSEEAAMQSALKAADLCEIFIVSEASVADAPVGSNGELKGFSVRAEKSPHAKCDRCWSHKADVGKDARHPSLCGRCVAVVGK